MNIVNDLSLNTLVISSVVGLCAWLLKGTAKFLGGQILKLIGALWENQAKMVLLNERIKEVVSIMDEVPKIKLDLNNYYKRLRGVEKIVLPDIKDDSNK